RRAHDRLERHGAHGRAVREALRRGARAHGDAPLRHQSVAGFRLGAAQQARGGRRAVRAARALRVDDGDKVGRLLVHGGADTYIPPRKGDKHALRIIREVFARGHEPPRARAAWKAADIPRRLWAWFRKLDEVSRKDARRSTSIAAALELCRKVLPRRAVVF